jgi:hypothetical protein
MIGTDRLHHYGATCAWALEEANFLRRSSALTWRMDPEAARDIARARRLLRFCALLHLAQRAAKLLP